MPTPYPREQMHRISYAKLTPEQILSTLSCVKGTDFELGFAKHEDGWKIERSRRLPSASGNG